MATGRREVAFSEATNGRSQHIFRKLEFAEPAQILDRSLRSEALVANPKYAGKRGLSEAIPNRVVDEWEIAEGLIDHKRAFSWLLRLSFCGATRLHNRVVDPSRVAALANRTQPVHRVLSE